MASCRRCGKCCLADFRSYVTAEDMRRWRKEGRTDILSRLDRDEVVWAGNHFVSTQNEKVLSACVNLILDGNRYACSIYETRPDTCRRFLSGQSELCPQYGMKR